MTDALISVLEGFYDRAGDAFLLHSDVLRREKDFRDLEAFLIQRDVLRVYALIDDIHRVSFLLELVVGHDEVLEEGVALASHVLHQVLRNKAEIFFDLFDQSVAVLEVQVPETQDFLEVVGHEFSADI